MTDFTPTEETNFLVSKCSRIEAPVDGVLKCRGGLELMLDYVNYRGKTYKLMGAVLLEGNATEVDYEFHELNSVLYEWNPLDLPFKTQV